MLNMSKIQFESNSQQKMTELELKTELCLICQRYNLKAIHNGVNAGGHNPEAVLNMSKIQFESNSQRKRP